MTRKVGFSKQIADNLVALQQEAKLRGKGEAFRRALIEIWDALRQRPLPPDDSDSAFGEIQYRTKHMPRHSICIAAKRPLVVHFSVSEDATDITGEPITSVT